MTTSSGASDGQPSAGIPPSAEASTPGEWTPIGAVSANHGEILIIANHARQPPGPEVRWDSLLAFTIAGRSRSEDGRVITFVADQYAPDWETGQAPAHATEEALVIRTYDDGNYIAHARTCEDPDHDGWCELRIKLHNHGPRDNSLDDLQAALLTMTYQERLETGKRLTEPDDGPAEPS